MERQCTFHPFEGGGAGDRHCVIVHTVALSCLLGGANMWRSGRETDMHRAVVIVCICMRIQEDFATELREVHVFLYNQEDTLYEAAGMAIDRRQRPTRPQAEHIRKQDSATVCVMTLAG